MKLTRAGWSTALAVAAATLALGACSDSATVVEPAPTPQLHTEVAQTPIVAGHLSFSTTTSLVTAALPGDVAVCKTGTDANFQITIRPHLYNEAGQPLFDAAGNPLLGPALTGWDARAVTLTNGTCIVFHGLSTQEFTIIATELPSPLYASAGITAVTINDLANTAVACDTDLLPAGVDLESCQTTTTSVRFEELNRHHGGLATFVNNPIATLRVCKIAGTGVAAGTTFNFTIGIGSDPAVPFTLNAGTGTSATSPNCIEGEFEAGTRIVLREVSIPAGVTVAISGGTVDNATQSTTLTLGAGLQLVTFTNSMVTPPPTTGAVRVCKVAGSPLVAGSVFSFTRTIGAVTTNFTLTAAAAPGNCTTIADLPAGTSVVVRELPSLGTTLAISGGTVNLANRQTTVTVVAGQTTTVTFTNNPAGCTLTQGFWKNRGQRTGLVAAALGRTHSFVVGGVTYSLTSGGQLMVGGSTLGGATLTAAEIDLILETAPKGGDAELILLHQLIAAELNILNGAFASLAVQTDIARAQVLLVGGISDAERAEAIAIAGRLDAFNNGLAGTSHCDD